MPDKPGRIYDEFGKPMGDKPDSVEDLNLPPGVQALIETRLNGAVDRLRELNHGDLRDLAKEQSKKWRYIAIMAAAISVLWGWFTWFVAPDQVKKWVQDQVDKRMTEPMLRDAADEAIRTKMGHYVDERIQPLTAQADTVAKRIETMGLDLATQQERLKVDQDAMRRQLRVEELAVAAKAGGLADYQELRDLASRKSDVQAQAQIALSEINWYFESDRAGLVAINLVDSVSRGDPGYSVEEAVALLYDSNSGNRQGAANCLYDKNRKSAVWNLCETLAKEKDLRVIARITRALEKITGARFSPLDKENALSWWTTHSTNSEYQAVYGSYLQAAGYLNRGQLSDNDVQEAIRQLDETIRKDPDALHARCLRAAFLVWQNKLDEAEKEFTEVESRNENFRWLLFWRPLLYMRQQKTEAAVESLNKALEKSPSLENFARFVIAYKPLLSNTNVVWPSAKVSQR